MSNVPTSREFDSRVVACRACPRLVEWREDVAAAKTKRFQDEDYWGKPVPSFGPASAGLLLVGLAPAAHGANRTGRMFTGDRSGDWLYDAMHAFGFATQPESAHVKDGLKLINARITAVAHCAPPQNKLTAEEIRTCSSFLEAEFRLCRKARVLIALGGIAYKEVLRHIPAADGRKPPKFGHGVQVELDGGRFLLASYHPSQQNTFTGRLTREMFYEIFRKASFELQNNS